MIVKNESKRLRACLESARLIAKQLIVVDTGSDDNSVEIAIACGAEVYHHPWEGSFAKARNLSLDYAREDWILILDGDEELDPKSLSTIEMIHFDDPKIEALNFKIINFTTDRALITEAGIIDQIRLFRNRPEHRYDGLVHNQLMNTTEGRALEAVETSIKVLHYGYTPSVWAAQNKDARIEMHERAVAEDPTNHFIRYNYGNHLKILKRYEEALEQFTLAVPPLSIFEGLSGEEIANSAEMIWGTSACFLGAFCANKLKRYEVAICLVEEALSRRPHLVDAKLRGAEAYIGLGKFDEAVSLASSALLDDQAEVVKSKAIHFDLPYRLGRALFQSGQHAQSSAAFASLLPHCTDITVFTHLCLGAVALKRPELWRYSRARGALLDPNDQDWPTVDLAITAGERKDIPLSIDQRICLVSKDPQVTSELLSSWRTHLEQGLVELNAYRREGETPINLTFSETSTKGTVEIYLELGSSFARLAIYSVQDQKLIYRAPERYQTPDFASPIESVALLVAQLSSLC